MAKDKCPECIQKVPGWLVQFADLMSLLLVFFVLLLSMAVMDKQKVEEYFQIMKKSMGFLDSTTDVREQTDKYGEQSSEDAEDEESQSTQEAVEEVAEEVEEVAEELNQEISDESQQIQVTQGKNEFTLDIPSTLVFEEGEYLLNNEESKRFIAKIARVIRTTPQTFDIEVVGHTGKIVYKSQNIPRDNWDLSALRSISVIKELIRNKISPDQLKVSGYAGYQPKSDIDSENNRVEIKFFASQSNNDVLDETGFFDQLEE